MTPLPSVLGVILKSRGSTVSTVYVRDAQARSAGGLHTTLDTIILLLYLNIALTVLQGQGRISGGSPRAEPPRSKSALIFRIISD